MHFPIPANDNTRPWWLSGGVGTAMAVIVSLALWAIQFAALWQAVLQIAGNFGR
jgi:hypothetical protein